MSTINVVEDGVGRGAAPPMSKWNEALFDAIRKDNIELAKESINNGADLTSVDGDGNTVVHEAAIAGSIEILNWLIHKCKISDLNVVDDDGNTPFHAAAFEGQIKALETLYQYNPLGITVTNNAGCTVSDIIEEWYPNLVKEWKIFLTWTINPIVKQINNTTNNYRLLIRSNLHKKYIYKYIEDTNDNFINCLVDKGRNQITFNDGFRDDNLKFLFKFDLDSKFDPDSIDKLLLEKEITQDKIIKIQCELYNIIEVFPKEINNLIATYVVAEAWVIFETIVMQEKNIVIEWNIPSGNYSLLERYTMKYPGVYINNIVSMELYHHSHDNITVKSITINLIGKV